MKTAKNLFLSKLINKDVGTYFKKKLTEDENKNKNNKKLCR